ncbi:MAG: hypothetical protein ACK5I7_06630 [Anaerotignum sp.]
MAYLCVRQKKGCDVCGDCYLGIEQCPNCNELGYEIQYFLGNEWIGCDRCVDRKYV